MTVISDVVEEAARAALAKLPLNSDKIDSALAVIMEKAMLSAQVQRKFAYALSDSGVIGGKNQDKSARVVDKTDDFAVESLPTLRMPAVVRTRQRKPFVKLNQTLSPSSVEFLNSQYAATIKIEYAQSFHHDHPVAAASKKIETEVVMMMLRSYKADLLRLPSNGYDFSVVDVGGDWRYHTVRNHVGVHCDVPHLDHRDRARDARRRMQLADNAHNAALVCRNKMQDCPLTAPYMMAVHSVLYTTSLMEICETMAARGVKVFVGTAHLPQELEQFDGSYSDPDYQYVVEWSDRADRVVAAYMPPQVRQGFGKYAFSDSKTTVRYVYPEGESRVYEHDYQLLREKLKPGVYVVGTTHGEPYYYEYKIVRRAGSLAYCTITHIDQAKPAHEVVMATAVSRPRDGYEIEYDENLVRDFIIKAGRRTSVFSPRQYFTAVGAHALTQVRNPNYDVETAISYAKSAAASSEANGVVLHEGAGSNSSVLRVVTGVAAFCWAAERSRLIESRLPILEVADAQREVQTSLSDRISSVVNVGTAVDAVKSVASSFLQDRVTSFAFSRSTTFADMKELYDAAVELSSTGLLKIHDLHKEVYGLSPLHSHDSDSASHVSARLIHALPPSYPTYEYELSRAAVAARQEGSGVVDLGTMSGTTAVEVSRPVEPTDVTSGQVIALEELTTREQHSQVLSHFPELEDMQEKPAVQGSGPQSANQVHRAVNDMIALSAAAEAERDQTAREVYDRVFDSVNRVVADFQKLKGLIKGQPTVLFYQQGELVKIWTLETVYHKGTDEYESLLATLAGYRCVYPEMWNSGVCYGTAVLRPDSVLRSDKGARTAGQTFHALVYPDLNVVNAAKLAQLRQYVSENVYRYKYDTVHSILRDEVAGSGKTYAQVQVYKSVSTVKPQGGAAVFASTKTAATTAEARLKSAGFPVQAGSVATVDSFLMNPKLWREYDVVMLDEVLQMHPGKVYAVMLITKAVVVGFGNTDQIGFIPFTRFHKPSVSTVFPYGRVFRNNVTYRIPPGDMLQVLRQPELYGSELETKSQRKEELAFFGTLPSFESQFTLDWLYKTFELDPNKKTAIMVYTRDQSNRLRPKLSLPVVFPEEGSYTQTGVRVCAFKTLGEAQGDDVEAAVLLRLATNQEPLHDDREQTIVALSRSKNKFVYLGVASRFPTLAERCIEATRGKIQTYTSLRDVGASVEFK